MREKILAATLSIVLAVFSWYLVTGREMVETWVQMPVEMVNPPKGKMVRSGLVSRIRVRVRGPRGLVRGLDSANLAYSLNMKDLKLGPNVVPFESDSIPLANALEVMEISPARMVLVVDEMGSVVLPVVPDWQGESSKDVVLGTWKATPANATVKGPMSVLSKMKNVATMPIELSVDQPMETSEEVFLNAPQEIEVTPSTVSMELVFAYKKRQLWVKIPLQTTVAEGIKAKVAQTFVRLLVEGPAPFFKKHGFRSEISASLSIPANVAKGKHEMVYEVRLPQDCSLVRAKPQAMAVTVR